MTTKRPPAFSFVDRGATNLDPDYQNNPLNMTGNAAGVPVSSRNTNTTTMLNALWCVYGDGDTVHHCDVIQDVPQRWSSTQLSYTIGGNAKIGGAPVDTRGVYHFDGYRVQLDDILLRPAGASPLLLSSMALPGKVWIYVDAIAIDYPTTPFAIVRTEAVGPIDPATPGANEHVLVGVDVDAGGLVTGHDYPTDPGESVRYGTREQRHAGPVIFNGDLTTTAAAKLQNGATISGALATCSAGLHVLAGATVIDDGLQVTAGATVLDAGLQVTAGLATFDAGLTVVTGTATVNQTLTAKASVNLGMTDADAVVVNGTTTLREDTTVALAKKLITNRVQFVGGTVPDELEMTAAVTGELVYNPTGNLVLMHYSTSGFAYAVGTQETNTGLLATHLVPLTNARVKPQAGQVRVIVKGWGQRAVLGLVTLQIEQSDGAFAWSNAGTALQVEWIGNGNADLWSPFFFERTLNPGTAISRFYRLKVTALGAGSCQIRESSIEVKPAQA